LIPSYLRPCFISCIPNFPPVFFVLTGFPALVPLESSPPPPHGILRRCSHHDFFAAAVNRGSILSSCGFVWMIFIICFLPLFFTYDSAFFFCRTYQFFWKPECSPFSPYEVFYALYLSYRVLTLLLSARFPFMLLLLVSFFFYCCLFCRGFSVY